MTRILSRENKVLLELASNLPDEGADKGAALFVTNEALAIVSAHVTNALLITLIQEVQAEGDKRTIEKHLNTFTAPRLRERIALAKPVIDSYVVQIKRPAVAQQAMEVRRRVSDLEQLLTKECEP